MASNNSYFKFRRVDRFLRDMNRKDCFDVLDMDGNTPNFKFVLATECSANIDDCLDEDGTLKEWDTTTGTGVQLLNTLGETDGLCPLLWNDGINGEATISVNSTSVVYELTDSIDYVKGIFLVSYGNGSGYVLAYSINNVPLEIQDDTLILNMVGMIWGTHYSAE